MEQAFVVYQKRRRFQQIYGVSMVEATGVEPVSENVSLETSPSAVDFLHSLTCA